MEIYKGGDFLTKSIMQHEKNCYICGTTLNLHCHH